MPRPAAPDSCHVYIVGIGLAQGCHIGNSREHSARLSRPNLRKASEGVKKRAGPRRCRGNPPTGGWLPAGRPQGPPLQRGFFTASEPFRKSRGRATGHCLRLFNLPLWWLDPRGKSLPRQGSESASRLANQSPGHRRCASTWLGSSSPASGLS